MNSKSPLSLDFKIKQSIVKVLLTVFIICAVVCLVAAIMMFSNGGPGLGD